MTRRHRENPLGRLNIGRRLEWEGRLYSLIPWILLGIAELVFAIASFQHNRMVGGFQLLIVELIFLPPLLATFAHSQGIYFMHLLFRRVPREQIAVTLVRPNDLLGWIRWEVLHHAKKGLYLSYLIGGGPLLVMMALYNPALLIPGGLLIIVKLLLVNKLFVYAMFMGLGHRGEYSSPLMERGAGAFRFLAETFIGFQIALMTQGFFQANVAAMPAEGGNLWKVLFTGFLLHLIIYPLFIKRKIALRFDLAKSSLREWLVEEPKD
jgi:hypothetical protein